MYDNQVPKIYYNNDVEFENVLSFDDSETEWCPKEVAGITIDNTSSEPEVAAQAGAPDELPAFQAVDWNGQFGVDLRPHVWDSALKEWLLLDSGSQCTAFPPDPGDQPIPGRFLRAVNGSRIKCYGQKEREANYRMPV